MPSIAKRILFALLLVPSYSFAAWQLATPSAAETPAFFAAGKQIDPHLKLKKPVFHLANSIRQEDGHFFQEAQKKVPFHVSYGAPKTIWMSESPKDSGIIKAQTEIGRSYQFAMSISGSLKENIERIMERYHWKVVWKAPYDYNFDGRITAASLPNAIQRLLDPFPLQAVMYMSNRTMLVVPRKV